MQKTLSSFLSSQGIVTEGDLSPWRFAFLGGLVAAGEYSVSESLLLSPRNGASALDNQSPHLLPLLNLPQKPPPRRKSADSNRGRPPQVTRTKVTFSKNVNEK